MSSVRARGLHKITTEAADGGEADYPRYLLDRIVDIAGDELVFFLPNFESNPADNEPVTDYGPHALPFQAYEGGAGNWAVAPTIRGSVLRYHMNGVDEAVDCADDDLFSMDADGTAGNEPSFSLVIAVKFNDLSDVVLISRYDTTNLAVEVEYLFNISGADLFGFTIYDAATNVRIGRTYSVALNDDQWYILIATYDGSRVAAGVRLFIDGVRVDDTDSIGGVYTAMHNTAVVTAVGYRESPAGALQLFLDGDFWGPLQTARALSDGGVASGAMAADGSDVLKMTQCYRRLLGI